MPARGFKIAPDRAKWKKVCWVCGGPFEAVRSTAICCSAKCKKVRSRHFAKHGKWPKKHPAAYAAMVKNDGFRIHIR